MVAEKTDNFEEVLKLHERYQSVCLDSELIVISNTFAVNNNFKTRELTC